MTVEILENQRRHWTAVAPFLVVVLLVTSCSVTLSQQLVSVSHLPTQTFSQRVADGGQVVVSKQASLRT